VTDPSRQSADAELFTPSASRLASLFYDELDKVGRFEPIAVDDLPPDPRTLLAHPEHMTVALESFHGCPVAVHVVAEWSDESSYARASVLSRQSDRRIVQFGMMRIWLGDLPEQAQQEIKSRQVPLGRVLIDHNVLREVELITLWEIKPGPVLNEHLKLKSDGPLYGRSAQILVDDRPTVQLLEIVNNT
jgi:hypothetical protein